MAAAAGGGRRRTQSNTTEDNALNMIAREAEAKLAAKRAARAEARSIRMKELERMQKEADEKMDKEYRRSLMNEEAIKKRIQSHLTTSPPVPEVEVNGPVATESQLKALQDNVQDLEVKYRSTMVNIAQLDNERQALSYQVDCLKERLEDEEETAENLRAEVAQRSKEYSKLSYENKKNLEEIERLQLMLAERDRILEEHNINLEEELMGITSTDGMSPRTNESVNMNDSVEIEHSGGSSGGLKSRGSSRRSSVPDDKETLLEQIRSLKEEVSELRRENDTESSRVRDLTMEEMRTASWEQREAGQVQVNEFEGSTFVDVSGEAADVEPEPAGGYVVNNNEKNEDFEVIDHNLQAPGGLPNFEDKSYEGVSTASMATESLDSLDVTESLDSEVPVEISVGPGLEPEDLVVTLEDHNSLDVPRVGRDTTKDSTKDYPDYDIVEDADLKYSSDVEEGARVRSRYYSLPPDEDDGFETPPESEDELRNFSMGDTVPTGHIESTNEDSTLFSRTKEEEQGRPDSDQIASAETDASLTHTSEYPDFREGLKPDGNQVPFTSGEVTSVFEQDTEGLKDNAVQVKEGKEELEKKEQLGVEVSEDVQGLVKREKEELKKQEWFEIKEKGDEVTESQIETSKPEAVIETADETCTSTDPQFGSDSDKGEEHKEAECKTSQVPEDEFRLEDEIVPNDIALASGNRSNGAQEKSTEAVGKKDVSPCTEGTVIQGTVELDTAEDRKDIRDSQSENIPLDLTPDNQINLISEGQPRGSDAGRDEETSDELCVTSEVPTDKGNKLKEKLGPEVTNIPTNEELSGVMHHEQKVLEDQGSESEAQTKVGSDIIPAETVDKMAVSVDSSSGQKSFPAQEEKKAEGESSPMPVPKKRKKKKGKKKGEKEDTTSKQKPVKSEEESCEVGKTIEEFPSEPQADSIPSVAIEGSDDSQIGDGKGAPFEEEVQMLPEKADSTATSDENSNSTLTQGDPNSVHESGALAQHVGELDPQNDEDSDQSGSEGGLKKRKSRKSKKEQKKEGCKNQ